MRLFISLFIVLFLFGCGSSTNDTQDNSPVSYEVIDSPNTLLDLSFLFPNQVIYVDVWASWCGPCLREMNSAKDLKKAFGKDDQIKFVYINISDNQKRWMNTIEAKKIEGIHIRANDQLVNDLETKYNVKSIPRYIIIDKLGKIEDDRAPRPSDDTTEKVLKNLL